MVKELLLGLMDRSM